MDTLLEAGLSNAVAAAVLALVAAGVARLGRRPALTHSLWLLVLLKLVTPPIIPLALPWPADEQRAAPELAEGRGTESEPSSSARVDPEPLPADAAREAEVIAMA